MWSKDTRIEPTITGRTALESREQAIVEVVLLNKHLDMRQQKAVANLNRENAELRRAVEELRRTVEAQKRTIYALECTMSRMDERASW